jgi:hypothetical protein
MRRIAALAGLLLVVLVILRPAADCHAGMPAILPTNWTADSQRPSSAGTNDGTTTAEARFQAISFFLACLLVSAFAVKALWNSVRRDIPVLPQLHFRPALGLVILWGLCFVVVLTMISGARELMTPGAWKKQGWTYTLTDAKPADAAAIRRQALERLRFALWQYAATHAGRFPPEGDGAIDPQLWQFPSLAGMRYVYVADQTVDQAGRLLASEPALNDDDRFVVLTNGFVGSMRTAEIERQFAETAPP